VETGGLAPLLVATFFAEFSALLTLAGYFEAPVVCAFIVMTFLLSSSVIVETTVLFVVVFLG